MLDGISIWQLLIILAIVALVFGTKRLRNIGGDMGSALRSFRSAFHGEDEKSADGTPEQIDPEKLGGFGGAKEDAGHKEHAWEGRGKK